MSKQKFKVGDNVMLGGNPFDEQIEEELAKFYAQKDKVQKVVAVKDATGAKGTGLFWIKTDLNDQWIDQRWFVKKE